MNLLYKNDKNIEIYYKSDWYNKEGKLLDRSNFFYEDLERIYNELKKNELLIILDKLKSFRNFVECFSIIGGMWCETKLKMEELGVRDVVTYCRYIISEGEIYRIDDDYSPRKKNYYVIGNMLINILLRNMAKRLIFRYMKNKVITLPNRKEMLRRLNEVSRKSYLQENFYPILLKSAEQELAVQEFVIMFMQAINHYTENMPSIAKRMMYKLVPEFIEALLVDDFGAINQVRVFFL